MYTRDELPWQHPNQGPPPLKTNTKSSASLFISCMTSELTRKAMGCVSHQTMHILPVSIRGYFRGKLRLKKSGTPFYSTFPLFIRDLKQILLSVPLAVLSIGLSGRWRLDRRRAKFYANGVRETGPICTDVVPNFDNNNEALQQVMDVENRVNQFFATSLPNEQNTDIRRSPGGEDVNDGLLGCDAVWTKTESTRPKASEPHG
jgi:hypothetical protein